MNREREHARYFADRRILEEQMRMAIKWSDHLPITITVNAQVTHQSAFGKPGRLKRNGVNRNKFRDEVQARCLNLEQENNLTRRVSRFNNILIQAAKEHVGKTKPGKKITSYMTPTVRASLK